MKTQLAIVNRRRGASKSQVAIVNRRRGNLKIHFAIVDRRRGTSKSQLAIVNRKKTLLAIINRRLDTKKTQDEISEGRPLACHAGSIALGYVCADGDFLRAFLD